MMTQCVFRDKLSDLPSIGPNELKKHVDLCKTLTKLPPATALNQVSGDLVSASTSLCIRLPLPIRS